LSLKGTEHEINNKNKKFNKNEYFFLNNARVHKTKSFNKIKEKLNVIYKTPYQSKYNPFEYV
jgi:hypothetical protein